VHRVNDVFSGTLFQAPVRFLESPSAYANGLQCLENVAEDEQTLAEQLDAMKIRTDVGRGTP
jgi:hypothetical protein